MSATQYRETAKAVQRLGCLQWHGQAVLFNDKALERHPSPARNLGYVPQWWLVCPRESTGSNESVCGSAYTDGRSM
jgi:hypothetical protein